MKTLFLFIFLTLSSVNSLVQEPASFIETTATITELDTKISGRRSSAMAAVNYTTASGENLTSTVRILHIPFLGTFKKVGDTLTVKYDANNPYLLKSSADSFLASYGLYILIGLGILLTLKRFIRKETT